MPDLPPDTCWHDRSRQTREIVSDVRNYRFSLLGAVVFALRQRHVPGDTVLNCFAALAAASRDTRAYFLSDPAFVIWLNRCVIGLRRDPVDHDSLQTQIQQLDPLLMRIEDRRAGRVGVPIGNTGILLQRFDLDPLVREVTPPTFDFERAKASADVSDRVDAEAIKAFAAQVDDALSNIRAADPDRFDALTTLIRSIGYLPDGDSRSCSAARYMGIIYLAGGEDSTLDLEESIVHEGAHQLLYNIGELTALTSPGSEKIEFELPWSGSRRDLFGYFHAYFIYLEIVKYYDKRALHAGTQRRHAERIRHLIHRGLELASEDIIGADGLTSDGRRLFDEMLLDTSRLRREPVPALT